MCYGAAGNVTTAAYLIELVRGTWQLKAIMRAIDTEGVGVESVVSFAEAVSRGQLSQHVPLSKASQCVARGVQYL